uniref:Uncharacterized protein n=1 Tax=Arundo donax TaxID=35708 RepID=A0A0A9H048_ARUDO
MQNCISVKLNHAAHS